MRCFAYSRTIYRINLLALYRHVCNTYYSCGSISIRILSNSSGVIAWFGWSWVCSGLSLSRCMSSSVSEKSRSFTRIPSLNNRPWFLSKKSMPRSTNIRPSFSPRPLAGSSFLKPGSDYALNFKINIRFINMCPFGSDIEQNRDRFAIIVLVRSFER